MHDTKYNLESYGKRAFSVAGPLSWNSLLMDIRCQKSLATFKEKLKTFLFIKSFSHLLLFEFFNALGIVIDTALYKMILVFIIIVIQRS